MTTTPRRWSATDQELVASIHAAAWGLPPQESDREIARRTLDALADAGRLADPDRDARVRADERARVAEAHKRITDAKRSLFARLIASAHLLDKPFVNAPDQSPWTRMKAAMGNLSAALDELDASTTPPTTEGDHHDR